MADLLVDLQQLATEFAEAVKGVHFTLSLSECGRGRKSLADGLTVQLAESSGSWGRGRADRVGGNGRSICRNAE